ncbi:hypothetical protein SeMB42_g06034 [Synchytrium endobioticum]|uniref:GYF domain-containing protein n=1 Tax=Synchytrium endobioticum TaxID=286115 RepID=A0A507CKX0_9FUNG|nr:hypothetical protein SeMB42_g06034 [Synchytrium endobioticum]TPX42653.1 hypothetical protein SeLEV6574_g05477 [Synchytrium endobioticum]
MAMQFGPQWMRKTVTEPGATPNNSSNPSGAVHTTSITTAPSSNLSATTALTPNAAVSARHASNNHQHHHQSHQHHHHSQAPHHANDHSGNGPAATTPNAAGGGAFAGFSNRAPPEPNHFKYTRDFMVGLYSPDLPLPDGCDLSEKILVSDKVLEPMANIPLTDTERKILASQAINSEVNPARRGGSGQSNRVDGKNLSGRTPGSAGPKSAGMHRRYDQRSGDRVQTRRLNGQDGDHEDDSPWDTPTKNALGVNGIYSLSAGGDPEGKLKKSDAAPNHVGNNSAAQMPSALVSITAASPSSMKDTAQSFMSPPRREADPVGRPGLITPTSTSMISQIQQPPMNMDVSPAVFSPVTASGFGATPIAPSLSAAMAPIHSTRSQTLSAVAPIGVSSLSVSRQQAEVGAGFNSQPNGQQQISARGYGTLFDPFGGIAGIGESLLATGGGSVTATSSDLHGIMEVRSTYRGPTPSIPSQLPQAPQSTGPPKWVYKDLQGVMQGPFSHIEMHEWYIAGYLQSDLLIRHHEGTSFEPLARIINQFGPDRPFLLEAEEYQRPRLPPPSSVDRGPGAGGLGLVGTMQGREETHQQQAPPDQGLFSPFGQHYSQDPVVPARRLQDGASGYAGWTDPAVSSIGRDAGWAGPIGGPDRNQYHPTQTPTHLAYQEVPQQQPSQPPQQYSPFVPLPQQPTALFSQFGNSNSRQSISPISPQHISPVNTPLPEKTPSSYVPSTGARTEDEVASQRGDYVESVHSEENVIDDVGTPEQISSNGWENATSPASSMRSSGKIQRKISVGTPTHERPYSRDEVRRQSLPASNNHTKTVLQAIPVPVQSPHHSTLSQQSPSLYQQPKAAQAPWGAPASGLDQKLSLKAIQEIEQREREERDKERQRRQTMAAAASGNDAGSWTPGATPWQAPLAKQKSLMEIMQEEEDRKNKEIAARAAVLVAASVDTGSSGGTRYADLARNTSGIGSAGWAAAAVLPPGRAAPAGLSLTPSAVRTGVAPRPIPVGASNSSNNNVVPITAAPGPSSGGAWNVVALASSTAANATKTSPAVAVVATPSVARPSPSPTKPVNALAAGTSPLIGSTLKSSPAPSMERQASNAPSESFLNWCRHSLKPLEKSTNAGVKVEEFIKILLSIPFGESSTLHMVCDDTLGGLTAIDPRKFADEFVKRRHADRDDSVGISGGATRLANVSSLSEFDTGNRFVTVNSKKKLKGKK